MNLWLTLIWANSQFQVKYKLNSFENFWLTFTKLSTANKSFDEFYISQEIKLNWADSFLYCKSHGLKLANISVTIYDDLAQSLQRMYSNGNEKILIDNSGDFNDETSNRLVLPLTLIKRILEKFRQKFHAPKASTNSFVKSTMRI